MVPARPRRFTLALGGLLLAASVTAAVMVAPAESSDPRGSGSVASVEAFSMPLPIGGPRVPPRPYMRSHGVRIKAGRVGYCTPQQVEEGCFLPAIFVHTRPLPVHPRGRVLVNTREKASKIEVNLFCGGERRTKKLGPEKWAFRVSRRQGEVKSCDGGGLDVTYAEGTAFAGGRAEHTFNTKPHKH